MIGPISLVIKATLILAAALGFDVVLRRQYVLACAAMWNAALMGLALLPAAVFIAPPLEISLLPTESPSTVKNRARNAAGARSPGPNETDSRGDAISARTDSAHLGESLARHGVAAKGRPDQPSALVRWFRSATLLRVAIVVYLAGCVACVLQLIRAMAAVVQARTQSQPVVDDDWNSRLAAWKHRLSIRRAIELRMLQSAPTPFVAGLFRPHILLPGELAANLQAHHRDAVLVHELSHVARGDYGWQLLQRILQCVLWFHPLAWLAARRMHIIRERACDEFSVHALGGGDEYGNFLLEIAARLVRRPALGLGLAMVRTPKLAGRLEAIAGSSGNSQCQLPRSARQLWLAFALSLVAVVACIAVNEAQSEPALEASRQKANQQPARGAGADETANAANAPEIKSPPAVAKPVVHPLSLSGRAVDSDGKPIAGAIIFVVSTNQINKTLGQTVTDQDGRYSFNELPLPVPAQQNNNFLTSATFQVFGRATGMAFAWRGKKSIFLDPRIERSPQISETGYFPDEKIELDLEFEPPSPVTGRFLDEQGQPIAGVVVRLSHCDYLDVANRETRKNDREFWSLHQAADLMPEQVLAESDSEGRFELKSIPPERICWLLIRHPDYAHRAVYVATSNRGVTEHDQHPVAPLPLETTLRATRAIPVQVVYADSKKPAAGVRVGAIQMRASGDSAHGTSDQDGKLFLRLPPGKYRLIGDPPPTSDYVRTMHELEVDEKRDDQPVVLKIDAGCVLILKAVDEKTGNGVAGVTFWYEMTEPRGGRTNVQSSTVLVDHPLTNADGELRAVVYPGKRRYGVGFGPVPAGYRAPDGAIQGIELELPAGKSVTAEFDLIPYATDRGQ